MSILIIEGTGFIRIELARKLLERGEEVVLFDVVINERSRNVKDKVKTIQEDSRTEAKV